MDLPPSAAPRRRAPPQGRLCGRSPASSERRRVASRVAVPAGAPVSVARPRSAVAASDGCGCSSPSRQATAPRYSSSLTGPNQEVGPPSPPAEDGELHDACSSGDAPCQCTRPAGSRRPHARRARYRSPMITLPIASPAFRPCSPFPAGFRHPRGFPALSLGNRGTGPPDRKGRRGRSHVPRTSPARPFSTSTPRDEVATPARSRVQSSPRLAERDAPTHTRTARPLLDKRAPRSGERPLSLSPDSWSIIPPCRTLRLNRGRAAYPRPAATLWIRGRHGHSLCRLSHEILRGPWPERRGSRAVRCWPPSSDIMTAGPMITFRRAVDIRPRPAQPPQRSPADRSCSSRSLPFSSRSLRQPW